MCDILMRIAITVILLRLKIAKLILIYNLFIYYELLIILFYILDIKTEEERKKVPLKTNKM